MKRSGHIPWGEWRLGFLVFVGLLLLVWASIRGGGAFLENRETLRARFPEVGGLSQGSPVWFRGVEVGSVGKISFGEEGDSSYIAVEFSVKNQVIPALNSDAFVLIAPINFFGEKFVDIREGTPGTGPLDINSLLPSQSPPNIDKLMATGEGILAKIDTLAGDLAFITRRIQSGDGSLGQLVNERSLHDDLQTMIQKTSQLAASLDESQGRTAEALVATANHLDTLMVVINQSQGTIGLMLRDPDLYNSLAGAAASTDTTLARISRGEGTAGKLTSDDRAYEELSKTLNRLNILIEDIQKNPGKYFKFSVF